MEICVICHLEFTPNRATPTVAVWDGQDANDPYSDENRTEGLICPLCVRRAENFELTDATGGEMQIEWL